MSMKVFLSNASTVCLILGLTFWMFCFAQRDRIAQYFDEPIHNSSVDEIPAGHSIFSGRLTSVTTGRNTEITLAIGEMTGEFLLYLAIATWAIRVGHSTGDGTGRLFDAFVDAINRFFVMIPSRH